MNAVPGSRLIELKDLLAGTYSGPTGLSFGARSQSREIATRVTLKAVKDEFMRLGYSSQGRAASLFV
jgi:hypothetical protein